MPQIKLTPELLFNEDFERIKVGLELNMSNRPYSKVYLEKMNTFFEEREEFEKCVLLTNFINELFTHGNGWLSKKGN